jgi:ERCC4-type nuclease
MKVLIDKCLLQIIVDTRQKEEKHKNIDDYFTARKIEIKPDALKVGDYMLDKDAKISVDTKQNIYELASDFFSKKEKARFQRECKRAKKLGIKLYILTEQNMTKERLLKWKSKRKKDGKLITKATGKQIYDRMQIYSLAFGVKWRFCKKSETGKKIFELFGENNG